jgi:threonyl-tRNA synthetase
MPVVTLPDGSQREFAQPVTVAEVAQSIGAGLARAALAGKVDGRLVDTSFCIATDASWASSPRRIPRAGSHPALDGAPDGLRGQGTLSGAQVTIGPVIENGFYYDFAYQRPFTLEDLTAIEQAHGRTCPA